MRLLSWLILVICGFLKNFLPISCKFIYQNLHIEAFYVSVLFSKIFIKWFKNSTLLSGPNRNSECGSYLFFLKNIFVVCVWHVLLRWYNENIQMVCIWHILLFCLLHIQYLNCYSGAQKQTSVTSQTGIFVLGLWMLYEIWVLYYLWE